MNKKILTFTMLAVLSSGLFASDNETPSCGISKPAVLGGAALGATLDTLTGQFPKYTIITAASVASGYATGD